jgi:hypothetical protein
MSSNIVNFTPQKIRYYIEVFDYTFEKFKELYTSKEELIRNREQFPYLDKTPFYLFAFYGNNDYLLSQVKQLNREVSNFISYDRIFVMTNRLEEMLGLLHKLRYINQQYVDGINDQIKRKYACIVLNLMNRKVVKNQMDLCFIIQQYRTYHQWFYVGLDLLIKKFDIYQLELVNLDGYADKQFRKYYAHRDRFVYDSFYPESFWWFH